MQTKKYPIPSARFRTHIKRNILNTLEKRDDSDASWLNDVRPESPVATTQTQEHTVCYEDLPTIPLSLFKPSLLTQAADACGKDLFDEDKTVQLDKRKKASINNPLNALLLDESISVITVLGPRRIYVERNGIVQQTPQHFCNEQHMLCVIEHLLHTAGQSMPLHRPLTNTYLPDGSLLTLALPPSALNGPALTLRKHTKNRATLKDLVALGSLNQQMADVLSACVQARLNIIVCGAVGSGRTTLLNALCTAIPGHNRIVTIEDTAELRLCQPQVIALQTQQKSTQEYAMTHYESIAYAERVHADHVVIGECRGNQAAELLQATYNGLHGVMTTMYAHDVKDCLTHFETLCLVASKEQSSLLPELIRTQIAQSIQIVVSLSPQHKIINIAEVQPLEQGPLKIQSLFHYQENKSDVAKITEGSFRASGFCPTFLERCKAVGIDMPCEVFMI